MSKMMVSVTLTKDSQATIRECLLSALNFGVDACLVVDTGSSDRTIEFAKSVSYKVQVEEIAWPNSFALARNEAFRRAAKTFPAEYGIMLDSDETIVFDDNVLNYSGNCDVYLCQDDTKTYWRERFFKLPLKGEFIGPTHEAFICKSQGRAEGIYFAGKSKTDSQLKAKRIRDIVLLEQYVKEHPKDSRWWYYLGDSYEGMGDRIKASRAYHSCIYANGWNEERAYAAFRYAVISTDVRPDVALSICETGLKICPEMAELAWYAGFLASKLGNWKLAILYARMCENICKEFSQNDRLGFKFRKGDMLPAETWGPSDIMRFAYKELGNTKEAINQEAIYQTFITRNTHV